MMSRMPTGKSGKPTDAGGSRKYWMTLGIAWLLETFGLLCRSPQIRHNGSAVGIGTWSPCHDVTGSLRSSSISFEVLRASAGSIMRGRPPIFVAAAVSAQTMRPHNMEDESIFVTLGPDPRGKPTNPFGFNPTADTLPDNCPPSPQYYEWIQNSANQAQLSLLRARYPRVKAARAQ